MIKIIFGKNKYIPLIVHFISRIILKSHNWDKCMNDLSDFVNNSDGSTDSDLDELGIPATSVAAVISS